MMIALIVLLCLGTGTVGGVFYAFSTFVMKALSEIPAREGIAAMQRINVVVINPMFMGVFGGTVLLSVIAAGWAVVAWSPIRSGLLLAAGVLYVVGTFLFTIVFNVPRNNQLARLRVDTAEAERFWRIYVREWTFWNHVRTAAALLASGCAAAALA